MTNISAFVYKDGEEFYFDPENYSENTEARLSVNYEDGDLVKWNWEGQVMMGTLREVGRELGLFVIEGITVR